jgi:vitamin B12 transporter
MKDDVMTLTTRLLIASVLALAPSAHALALSAIKADIIVTGSRTGVDAREMTDVFSVVPFIDQLPVSAASDLLKFTPGLSVSRLGPVGSLTQVRIRGSEANQTLVFIDGIEANDPAAGEFDFSGLSAVGAQRIEILRGPQSALWGTEAIGGVVSITTKIPSGSYAQAQGGSQASSGAATGTGFANALGEFAAHLNFTHTDGVSVARQGREKDGFTGYNASVVGKLRPSDMIEIGGALRFQTTKIAFDDFVGGTISPLADANVTTQAQRVYARGFAKLNLNDGNWTHETNVRLVDTRNRNLTDDAVDSTTFGNRIIFGYQTAATFGSDSVQHKIIGAADYRRERFRNVTPNASPFFDPNQRQKRTQFSLIGEYRLKWNDLNLAASLRNDDNNSFRDAVTWRTSARFAVNDRIAVRGSYGTAITNPTFYEQFGFAPASFTGNPNVKPERGQGFDFGFDTSFNDLTFKATYFNTRLTDEIISVFNQDFTSSVANAANKSRREGIELEGFWRVDTFQFSASYTYTKSSEPQSRSSTVQVKELRRPEHTASLAALWTGANEKLTVSGALAYQGRNRDVAFGANFSRVLVTLSGYVSASANAAYKISDNTEVFAQVENAFDVRAEDVFGYAQPGISARAGVRIKFGQ